MTSSGFKFWYFVCDADAIIAAPVPFMSGALSSFAYLVTPFFGLLGALIFSSLDSLSKRPRQKITAELQNRPSRLKYAPNKTFKIHDLRSIQAKTKFVGAGGLGTWDIVLEKANGTRMAFGAHPTGFKQFSEKLQQLYPGLFAAQ
jgi:hypothetical protein